LIPEPKCSYSPTPKASGAKFIEKQVFQEQRCKERNLWQEKGWLKLFQPAVSLSFKRGEKNRKRKSIFTS